MRVPAAATLLFFAPALARAEDKPAPVDFAKQVRPILAEHCFRCHGPKEQKNSLRLDRRDDALRGGESNEPAIVPGNPDKSLAVIYIRGDDPEVMMPPEGERVPKAKLELLVRWIKEGASWPDEAPDKAPSTGESVDWPERPSRETCCSCGTRPQGAKRTTP